MVSRKNHPFSNSSKSSAMFSMVPTPREGRACCLTATNREGEVVHDGLMTPWVYIYHVWPMFWSFFTTSGCFYCSSVSVWLCTEAAAVDKLLSCWCKAPFLPSGQQPRWALPVRWAIKCCFESKLWPSCFPSNTQYMHLLFLCYREPECIDTF